ncbi:MAG: hypothetical protein ACE5DL_05005, partial [Nitrosopumilaceae archaeon]
MKIPFYPKFNDFRFKIAIKIINNKISHSLNLINEFSKFYNIVNVVNFKKIIDEEEIHYKNHLNDFKCINGLNDVKRINNQDSLQFLKALMTFEGRI